MALYSETYEKQKISYNNDAIAILSASGIYVSARWMVRYIVWDIFKDGLFGEPQEGDYNEDHIQWLVEKSIEEIDRRRSDGFQLPGKDKNDDGKASLQAALCESVANSRDLTKNNTTLVGNNTNLVGNNASLVENNATLVTTNAEQAVKIDKLESELEAMKQLAKSENEKTPKKTAGSTKKAAATPGTTSKKKKTPTTKDHDFVDNEKVTIKDSYSYKSGYAGKHGQVDSSTKSMVTVRFADGTEPITLSSSNVEHGWM